MKKDYIAALMMMASVFAVDDKCCVFDKMGMGVDYNICIEAGNKDRVREVSMGKEGLNYDQVKCGAHVFATICPAGVTRVKLDNGKTRPVCVGHSED